MSRKLFAPLAVVLALALAACGGGTPDNSTTPATTTAPAATTAPATTTPAPATTTEPTMAPAAPAP